jgi:hypothetical protein
MGILVDRMLFHCFRAVHEGGKIEIENQSVRVAWHKALPLRVFMCPSCEGDKYRLHRVDAWACSALLKSGLGGKEAEAGYTVCERTLRDSEFKRPVCKDCDAVWELGGLHWI